MGVLYLEHAEDTVPENIIQKVSGKVFTSLYKVSLSISENGDCQKVCQLCSWATPHHHVLPFIGQYDRAMACRLLNDTVASFRGHGIWEWVGPFYPAAQGRSTVEAAAYLGNRIEVNLAHYTNVSLDHLKKRVGETCKQRAITFPLRLVANDE